MTMLNLIELEKVNGGESVEDIKYYLDTVIYFCRKAGMTLEEVLAELRSQGRSQEVLDYVAANW